MILAGLWAFLLTPVGLRTAARLAERGIAAGSGFEARIEDVSGVLPFSLRVGRFALADAKGPWLVIGDAAVSWSPAALLRGRIEIREIAADVVRLLRAPQVPDTHSTPTPLTWPPRFPSLPPILLDRLAVNRLMLDKELAGQAAVLSINGRLAESGQGAVALALDAKRLDGDMPLTLNVGAALNYADWRLAVKAHLNDAAGGLLCCALAGPNAPALDAALTGDGPLDAWKGRLSAKLGTTPLLAMDLGLAVPLAKDALAAFTLEARAAPPPGLLPAFFEGLLGPRPHCSVAARVGITTDALFLDKLTLDAAAGSLALAARLDPVGNALSATAKLAITDASRLDGTLGGTLGADMTASGTLLQPNLAASITAHNFHAGPVTLADAALTATAQTPRPMTNDFPGAILAVSGTLRGLAGPDGTTLLGQSLELAANGSLAPDGALAIENAALTGAGGSATLGGGRISGETLAGHVAVALGDVAGAASLGGLRLGGSATVAADIASDPNGHGTAKAVVSLARLAAPDPADTAAAALAALLGPAPGLSVDGAFSPDGATLSELSLTGKGVSLAGTGRFVAATGHLEAKTSLKAADLSLLAPALGQPCSGSLEAGVTLSGPLVSPHLALSAKADRLHLGELALTDAACDLTMADAATRPAGKLTFTARREGEAARLETTYVLAGTRLTVADLRLTAPEAAFAGEADIDTATGRVAGKLSGNAANLAGLGRFVGLPLGGSLKISASAAKGATQSLTLDLTGTGLRLPGLTAGTLTATANLDDLAGRPRGKASLAGKTIEASGLSLASLSATASGDGRTLALAADAKGRLNGQMGLDASVRGNLAPAEAGRQRLTLQTLSGSLEGHPFALNAPTTLNFGSGVARVDTLALTFDKARVTAAGGYGPTEASGKVSVEHFPLPLLTLFGLAGIDGTADVSATLSGSPAKPQVTAQATLSGLRLAAEQGKGLPSVGLWAKAACTATRLDITAGLTGKGGKGGKSGGDAITVQAGVPVRLSLAPAAFDLPPNGALSGRMTADSDLSDLAAVLARFNTRLTGRLTADLALGGSVAAPTATGALALAANRVENADAGLVLTNVTLQAEAAGGVLTIAKASGEDGRGGRFTLAGHCGFANPAKDPVDLKLTLARLRVVGLDLATAVADGSVAVSGTLDHMRAAGTIAIGPADINLPTSLPPDVAVIPVTYINDPAAPKKPAKVAPPAAARHIDLDLKVVLGQAVYVRGMGLESRWTGQLAITGTAAEPVVIGKYSVAKGSLDLLGSTLEITKGELAFTGASPPTPAFDIRAETTKNNITAGIAITGDAGAPSITLTSTPPLPRDEILSRLLFGQSAGSLSPLQAAQLAQAAASLYAGGTPTSILARTRRIIGLDQLTIVPGKAGMAGSVLKAGKEIFKGVTVGVEQGMGAQSGAVSVEVQVTPNITVDSRVGTDNKQGVGVNWKWDY
ncbi:translocation/assembly module TamB domain-containing protein [Desulfovibrio sp. TomC]|uniref:translocation/assembly module TamB domain-containing protein n=1 Tax=Desulfovibrio sp. TomC TaxID=1562888 RepID=UPI001E388954|nr:translocation/assembly module TamB domain-containing protein [Desulfovibrio sp. TomC]